ncbi:hypothetical protein D3C76_1415670 [compost metagenome]
MQLDGLPGLIGRFIQLHRHPVRTCRPGAVTVVLPAVACPEAHAADRLIRGFHLQTIGAPLHREAHFSGLVGGQVQRLFALNQIFLIKL